MRVGQQTVIIYLSKVLASILGFAGFVYLSNKLGASIIGRYNLAIAVASWITLFSGTSLAISAAKRLSENEADRDQYISTAVVLQAVLLSIFIFSLVVFKQSIIEYTNLEGIGSLCVLVVAFSLYQLIGGIIQGQGQAHIEGLLDPVKMTLMRGLQLVAFLCGAGLSGLVYGHAFGLLFTTVPGIYYIRGNIVSPTKKHALNLIEFSKYAWASGAESRGWSNIDILSLGLFVVVPDSFIGSYGAAWSISGIISLFSTSISSAMFPQISESASSAETEAVAGYLRDALVFNGLLMIPGFVGGLLLSRRILLIYGPDFAQGAIVLAPIILGRLLYNYKYQFSNTLNATDHPDIAMRVSVLFLVLNISLNLIFIHLIGGVGAAIATVLSAGVSLVVSYYYCKQLVTISLPIGEISKQILAAIVMGIIVFFIQDFVPLGDPIVGRVVNTGVIVLIGGITYFVLIYGLSSYVRKTVDRNLPV